jgi:hypothetical protein
LHVAGQVWVYPLAQEVKVFWFFSSAKNFFLPVTPP